MRVTRRSRSRDQERIHLRPFERRADFGNRHMLPVFDQRFRPELGTEQADRRRPARFDPRPALPRIQPGMIGSDPLPQFLIVFSRQSEHRRAALAVLEKHSRKMVPKPFPFAQTKPKIPVLIVDAHGLVVSARQLPVSTSGSTKHTGSCSGRADCRGCTHPSAPRKLYRQKHDSRCMRRPPPDWPGAPQGIRRQK